MSERPVGIGGFTAAVYLTDGNKYRKRQKQLEEKHPRPSGDTIAPVLLVNLRSCPHGAEIVQELVQ